MKLENQVTSLELSKRLKELGVEQKSLFKWVNYLDEQDTNSHKLVFTLGKVKLSGKLIGIKEDSQWSAYTVAELGEKLPSVVQVEKREYMVVNYKMEFPKDYFKCAIELVSICNKKFVEKTEVEARAKMLIYLLENKLINI